VIEYTDPLMWIVAECTDPLLWIVAEGTYLLLGIVVEGTDPMILYCGLWQKTQALQVA